jgi:hypothetical protein
MPRRMHEENTHGSADTLLFFFEVMMLCTSKLRSFTRAEFVHEGRKLNVDDHLLARSSVNLSIGRHVWFLEPPDKVCNSYVIE